MSFYNTIQDYPWEVTKEAIYSKTADDVRRALEKEIIDINDFQALISPAAEPFLEEMAEKSKLLTQKRFGKTIQMFAPLYVSNVCANACVYCGFNHANEIERKVL
ncbi:MAG: 2-iminoacetate synthase ThiH, partial [Bacteroidales bacterium]|nr:2-iminoacetate synthase ThiH [Bacteroidales bacterium]